MTYQITYFSPNGHAERMANALYRLLPPDTRTVPLEKDSAVDADIHLVGFDLKMMDLRTLPLNIANYLKQLGDKTVFLFATVPFQLNDVLDRQVHNAAAAALPAECDYRGLYVCPAQAADLITNGFRSVVQRHPDNTRAKHWLERCEKSNGHPDEEDIRQCCRFAQHVLRLNF